uniref:Uncharacterized protein n=1 Tax=Dictyoglomus turgidum TaxID=513050 RepID=A0A7C3WLD3_9BACT
MGFITHSDVLNSINYHLSEKLGNYAKIFDYNNQIFVIIEPSQKNTETIKFGQVMDYLSFKVTWFYKKEHFGESVFEKTIANLDVPLKVRGCQRTIFLPKPTESELLDKFLLDSGSRLKEVYEMREKLKTCYKIIDESLSKKKKFSYVQKSTAPKEQQSLLNFYDGQLPLDYFLLKSQITKKSIKKPRNTRWRKIRFDVIFEMSEIPALIFAEVKAFPTLRNSDIISRKNQLLAYDAWLKIKGDEAYTPIIYLLPTLISHREISIVSDVKERSRREIVPVCVSTSNYLKEDLKRRKNKTEIVKKASLKYEMDPEVVKTYLEEYEYLSDAADALREYLYL